MPRISKLFFFPAFFFIFLFFFIFFPSPEIVSEFGARFGYLVIFFIILLFLFKKKIEKDDITLGISNKKKQADQIIFLQIIAFLSENTTIG